MVLNNRPITYSYTESDLIETVTPNKPLFGGNLLYANTEYFDAKAEETSLTKRYNRTYKNYKRWRGVQKVFRNPVCYSRRRSL